MYYAPENSALACIELSSIARGMVVLDAIAKRAPVKIRHRGRYSGGKYLIVIEGDVASVEESFSAAMDVSQPVLLDSMMLATAHEDLIHALDGKMAAATGEAVLLFELTTVASILRSLDSTLKLIETKVVDLHCAMGIGGKGFFAVEAPLHDVEFARDELLLTVDPELIISAEIIARPHEEMWDAMGHHNPFAAYR